MNIGSVDNSTGGWLNDYGDAKHISAPGVATSWASPMAAGLSALVLEANPGLGFRDVHALVAYSARYLPKAEDETKGFALNGSHTLNGAGLHYSHFFGFGVYDVQAAVALARDWLKPSTHTPKTAFTQAADPTSQWMHTVTPTDTTPATVSGTANIKTILYVDVTQDVIVEALRFKFYLQSSNLSKMQIRLISPSGTESYLMTATRIWGYEGIAELTSRRFWGESSKGQWRVEFFNNYDITTTATVHSPHFDLYGVNNETDQRFIYTDEWQTTWDKVASPAAKKHMRWLADQDGGNDSIYMSAVNTPVSVALGSHGHIELQGQRIGLINAAAMRNAFGGRADDRLLGQAAGGSLLVGNDGSDRMVAMGGGNTIEAGPGPDWVWLGTGDTATGGEGADTFIATAGNWGIANLQDLRAWVADFDPDSDNLLRYQPSTNSFELLRSQVAQNHFEWVSVTDTSVLKDLHEMRLMTPKVQLQNVSLTAQGLRLEFDQALQSSDGWVSQASFGEVASGAAGASAALQHHAALPATPWRNAFGRAFDFAGVWLGDVDGAVLDAQSFSGNAYLWSAKNNATVMGGYGNDVLVTQDANGGDSLQGGPGADRFVWKPNAAAGQGVSTVLDFNAAQGDVLDLSHLLAQLNPGATVDDRVQLVLGAQDAHLKLDLGMKGQFAQTLTIHLVNAVANGSMTGQDGLYSLYRDQIIAV